MGCTTITRAIWTRSGGYSRDFLTVAVPLNVGTTFCLPLVSVYRDPKVKAPSFAWLPFDQVTSPSSRPRAWREQLRVVALESKGAHCLAVDLGDVEDARSVTLIMVAPITEKCDP